ncbi:concanavalin A-like lectin/glucanase [Basidiobolus meristosporus CBS 931.73]|uniref:Concanavalin A-like lectin/glucanase n=1 Tax=Basidiobolus meristosporus CBS 931.73 TaxID=1314790 RepID=A0A1Y1YSU3_9FUNG|nr:concanavalin A-like lectin/glucanase [Basidiobolus meristosporus CBS 931.73]|eukprot:ORY00645.1 concanavalin A-like lectin/glucanase [Basidiobolus meristosporus CBS 931.73]
MKSNQFGEKRLCTIFVLIVILAGFLALFIAYPIVSEIRKTNGLIDYSDIPKINRGGRNSWIDYDTPKSAYHHTALDGSTYDLVFSDEFEQDGRSFKPGADKAFEAVNLHYWVTGDKEWYHPDAVTTRDGKMEITITKEEINNMEYKSGMVQSWNKFCFTGGYIEINVSLPGAGDVSGLWPGLWTMGNLGRAGYGATTEGVWPYSYDSCDEGVTLNQSMPVGLSGLPGQKLNKCVCPGQDHPSPGKGRSAPEIDIIEVVGGSSKGTLAEASQTHQIAPFDPDRKMNTDYNTIYDQSTTKYNTYTGTLLQQFASALTQVPLNVYDGKGYQTYGFEYEPGPNGYVTWVMNGVPTWRLDAKALGPNPKSKVAQRLIAAEPMYLIMNLGLSDGFSPIQYDKLVFPSIMRIDYVRLYQNPKRINIGCNPDDFPTSKYINKHWNAYNNPNLTTWAQAGYSAPPYNLDGSC